MRIRWAGTVLLEAMEHATVVPPLFGSGVQLAVGKGARTAFAEGIVRFGIQYPPPVQGGHIPAAGLDRLSPIDHHGPKPKFHQPQRGKQTRRPGTDDDHRGGVNEHHGS